MTDIFCPSNNSCSIRQSFGSDVSGSNVGDYIFPESEQCQILSDSKKVKSDVDECFKADFISSLDNENMSILNKILVKAYKLKDEQFSIAADIFGLEVLIPYAGYTWKNARFRLSNNQDCGDNCSPRCVTIQRQGTY